MLTFIAALQQVFTLQYLILYIDYGVHFGGNPIPLIVQRFIYRPIWNQTHNVTLYIVHAFEFLTIQNQNQNRNSRSKSMSMKANEPFRNPSLIYKAFEIPWRNLSKPSNYSNQIRFDCMTKSNAAQNLWKMPAHTNYEIFMSSRSRSPLSEAHNQFDCLFPPNIISKKSQRTFACFQVG